MLTTQRTKLGRRHDAMVAAIALVAGGAAADPPIIDSIEPAKMIEGFIPEPDLVISGENFLVGNPNDANRPTVTLIQQDVAEFSARGFVNISGTTVTLPPTELSLLHAPTGVYDVVVTRPDGEFDVLEGGLSIVPDEPQPGEIAFVTRSAWGGRVQGVDVQDDIAYLAVGRRLVTLDISDPNEPIELGSLFIHAGVNAVKVRDGYAFVAALDPYRFSVIDVSDPTSPSLVSVSYSPAIDFPKDIVLYGDLAYAASTDIDVYDVSDPNNAVFLGDFLGDALGDVVDMAVAGDLLFVGRFYGELSIYDLASDPVNPDHLGTVSVGQEMQTMALSVEGDYAVWAVEDWIDDCFHVVDVSDPTEPFVTGVFENEAPFVNRFLDVDLVNGMAYVANAAVDPDSWSSAKGLLIFDILTDPTTPTLVGKLKTHGNVVGVEVFGTTAYGMDEGEGMIIVDVSDPTDPVRLGVYHSPGSLRKAWKSGDLLYVSDSWNGFTILDVSDATRPEVLGVYLVEHIDNMGIDTWGITVQDDRAYLGAGHMGLEVVDVSSPHAPALLGAYRIQEPANPEDSVIRGVTVSGDVAHVGLTEGVGDGFIQYFGYFVDLDVSDPGNNVPELGRVSLGGGDGAAEIAMNPEEGVAFIAKGHSVNNGEVFVDVLDMEIIHEGARPVGDVALEGAILYLADGDDSTGGLIVEDVSDPENPEVLAIVESFGPAYALAVQDGRLYIVCGGTLLFDVADPTTPTLLADAPHSGGYFSGPSSTEVHVAEPFVYVTSAKPNAGVGLRGSAGLVILEVVGLHDPADFDGDGTVGPADLVILLGSWGRCPPKGVCPADLDDDGMVGPADLILLLGSWS